MAQLLCTFSTEDEINDTIADILKLYEIVYNQIFVLQNVNHKNELFCTYNINVGNVSSITLSKTISLHRKKQTNTLYTINALNQIIKLENNGILDQSYMINWKKYSNSIIVTDEDGVKVIPTKIYNIISTKNL